MLDLGLVAQNVVRNDGQGRAMLELARELHRRRHDVTVYAHRIDDELAKLVRFHHVPEAPGPQLLDDVAMLVRATRAVGRAGHDAVCALGPSAMPRDGHVLYLQFSHRGWRRTWTPATRPGLYHRTHAWLAQQLEARAAARATAVVATTQRLADEVLGRTGDPRVIVAPNGVDIEELPLVGDDERAEARATLGVGEGQRVVAFLGEYRTSRKGLDTLVEAVAAGPVDEHLLVAGRGRADRLAALAGSLGAGDRVRALGFRPPRTVIAAADAVVVPSLYEPFSLVALEAAALGVPVVVSEVAGAAAALGAADAAAVVPAGDAAALRAALDRIHADAAERARRRDAARQVAASLDWPLAIAAAADAVEAAAERDDASDGEVGRGVAI